MRILKIISWYAGEEAETIKMWRETPQRILQLSGDDLSIIHMDFVRDANEMQNCLLQLGKTAECYTRKGMASEEKHSASARFRRKKFQFLVVTEAFEAVFHNAHVT